MRTIYLVRILNKFHYDNLELKTEVKMINNFIPKFFHEQILSYRHDQVKIPPHRRKKWVDLAATISVAASFVDKHGGYSSEKEFQRGFWDIEKNRIEFAEILFHHDNKFSNLFTDNLDYANNFYIISNLATLLLEAGIKEYNYIPSVNLIKILNEVGEFADSYRINKEFLKTKSPICAFIRDHLSKMKHCWVYYNLTPQALIDIFFICVDQNGEYFYIYKHDCNCEKLCKGGTYVFTPDYPRDGVNSDYELTKFYDNTISNIIPLCETLLTYISNPSGNGIIQDKIAKFSSRKSKREYEKSHFSELPYKELDLNYTQVRAFEQGKSWYKKAHVRWQRCGKGLEQVKLVFLAPQHPKRRAII